jgi:hypothetical protein
MTKYASLLFALFSVVCHSQQLELKGLQVSVSTLSELQEKFPATRVFGSSAMLTTSAHTSLKCGPVLSRSNACLNAAIDDLRVAGGSAGDYSFDTLDTVIESIRVSFPISGYDTAAGALKLKYGAPTTTDNTPSQNRMGASFDNERLTWSLPTGTISVSKRGSKIDESRLTMTSARYQTYLQEAEAARIKKGAKEL